MTGPRSTASRDYPATEKFATRRLLAAAILGAAASVLVGCAPTVLGKSADGIAFDNPSDSVATIDVLAKYQRRRALDLADQHCRRFGRVARLTRRTANVLQYDCVE